MCLVGLSPFFSYSFLLVGCMTFLIAASFHSFPVPLLSLHPFSFTTHPFLYLSNINSCGDLISVGHTLYQPFCFHFCPPTQLTFPSYHTGPWQHKVISHPNVQTNTSVLVLPEFALWHPSSSPHHSCPRHIPTMLHIPTPPATNSPRGFMVPNSNADECCNSHHSCCAGQGILASCPLSVIPLHP